MASRGAVLLLFALALSAALSPSLARRSKHKGHKILSRPNSFVQFSDVHINPIYNLSVPALKTMCNQNSLVPVPMPPNCASTYVYGCYGKYLCDPPATLFQSALDFAVSVNPQPNFVLVTGDFAAHNLKSADLVLGAISQATAQLRATYPKTPIVVTVGNNDFYPKYSNGVPIQSWLAKLLSVWSPILPNDNARQMFGKYGCYAYPVSVNLTVISINSVAFSPSYAPYPPPDSALQDFQFSWLDQTLANLTKTGKKAYLIGHIPPGSGLYNYQALWHDAYTQSYYDIVSKYEEAIEGEFFAHTHRDEFRVEVNATTGRNASVFIAPSISPNTETNPSFRVVMYKAANGEVVDYVQYFTDLLGQINGKLNWKVEYDFDLAYKLPEPNTMSLFDLFQQLKAEPAVYAEWISRYTVLYSPSRQVFFCVINYPNREDFDKCVAQISPEFQVPIAPPGSKPASYRSEDDLYDD